MKKFFIALCAFVLALALAAPVRGQDTPEPAAPDEDIREIVVEDDSTVITYPEYTGKGSDAVRAKINAALAAPVQQLRDLAKDPELEPPSLSLEFNVTRRTGNHLSVAYSGSIMRPGAAHPVNIMFGVTVDLGTGRALALPDLFASGCDVEAELLREAKSWLANAGEDLVLLTALESIGLNNPEPWKRPGFYLTQYTLAIFYQEYIYTPHAYGPLVMELPTKSMSECLKKEYLPAP